MSLINFFRNLFSRTKNENTIITDTAQELQSTSSTEPLFATDSNSYVFLDTETTGLNRDGLDEIVEIAIVDETGEILLNTLVKPIAHKAWKEAEQVHGISPSDVATAPTLSELLPSIERLCKGKTVVCYNAPFDTDFFPPNFFQSVQCAMRAFGEVSPNGKKWVSLDSAAQSTGYIPTGRSHRALEDALACKHVWLVGIEKARIVKEKQIIPTINARYTTVDGEVVNAVFSEVLLKELEGVTKGTVCKLWSKSSIEFINVYNGGMGGSGKLASLRKEDNHLLAEIVTEDNDVHMHVIEVGDAYYDCEITVSRKEKVGHFQTDTPIYYNEIDSDIYRCFIANKTELSDFVGTHQQLSLVEDEIEKLCKQHYGRYYKTKANGAKFAIIFSTSHHSPRSVYQLQQDGYKVTTFDRALIHFDLAHMWNLKNYIEHREMMKKYVSILD